jgi:hypothetical protein
MYGPNRAWISLLTASMLLGCGDEGHAPFGFDAGPGFIREDGGTSSPLDDERPPISTADAGSTGSSGPPGADAATGSGVFADASAMDGGAVGPDAAAANDGKAEIGGDGGTLAAEDDSALLVVPAGAVGAATPVTVTRIEPPPLGALLAVELGPSGTEFSAVVTLTISYAELDLSGVDPARLALARLDGDEWRLLPDAILSLQARTLSVGTESAATYGVILGPALDAAVPSVEVPSVEVPPTDTLPDAGACGPNGCAASDGGR